MAGIREFATPPRVLGAIVVPALSWVVDHTFGTEWLTAILLTIYVTLLFELLIDRKKVPPAYLGMRRLHAEALEHAGAHPILTRRYEDGIMETDHLLNDIIKGHFEYNVTEVPEMSIVAMESVDDYCLLTFPLEESENFLVPRTGQAGRYYDSMVAASRRIKAHGGRGVVRIFILTRQDDIAPSLIDFMRQNQTDGIHVRVIFEERLPQPPEDVEFRDFGCYQTSSGHKWIMALRKNRADSESIRYVVDMDQNAFVRYKAYGDDIAKSSLALDDFEDMLLQPVNGHLWPTYFAERRYTLNPPHGLSEQDADLIVDSALRKIHDPAHATILVLGFTPKLVRRLVDRGIGYIISIDNCQTKPWELDVIFETENWLKLKGAYEADAIVFDESINNLSRLQLGLFVANMAKALKPGGLLVGRAMGRFEAEKANTYAALTQGSIMSLLRSVDARTHDDVAPLAICMLHAEVMGFSPALSTADCAAWNASLLRMRNQFLIDHEEFARWHLPFDFRLLSPLQSTLTREASSAGLALVEIGSVMGTYVEKWPDIHDFYRILSFEKLA